MKNTKERLERPGQPEPPVDYFLVVAHFEEWYVSREMAQAIEASLNQTPAPQWVMFVDLTGARVRVRTRLIEYVYQCTAEQRALPRPFHPAPKADRRAQPNCERAPPTP